ncbi:MAG: hypothetical protein QXR68_05345 [Pyrobaculum sp.]
MVFSLLLTTVVVVSSIAHIYEKTLEGFRIVKFVKDQWGSFTKTIDEALCQAAEDLAQKALAVRDVSTYRRLGEMLDAVLREVRNKTLLKGAVASWEFDGDVFKWNITFLKYSHGGVINWLRPTALINAASEISQMYLDLDVDISNVIKERLPPGVYLSGVVYGYLIGNMTYSGYLTGVYTLRDKTPLRCRKGFLEMSIYANHYATLVTNSTSNTIYLYIEISIES